MTLTTELIKNIVLLCTVNGASATPLQVDVMQAKCHAFYTHCVTVKKNEFDKCILKRNENYTNHDK